MMNDFPRTHWSDIKIVLAKNDIFVVVLNEQDNSVSDRHDSYFINQKWHKYVPWLLHFSSESVRTLLSIQRLNTRPGVVDRRELGKAFLHTCQMIKHIKMLYVLTDTAELLLLMRSINNSMWIFGSIRTIVRVFVAYYGHTAEDFLSNVLDCITKVRGRF